MKLRNLMVWVLLATFAFAAATVIVTDTVHGTGRAVNHDGHRAYFTVDGVKITHDGHVAVHGAFQITVAGNTDADSTVVHLTTFEGMNVTDNVGVLGGPAVLRIQHGTTV